MEQPGSAESRMNPLWIVFWLVICCHASPHQVKQLSWQIFAQTGEMVWETTQIHTPQTWWPTLTPDFCQLAAGLDTWDIPTVDLAQLNKTLHGTRMQQMTAPGCSSPTARCRLAQSDFYVCPKDGRNRALAARCGGYEEFFCASWGCETTGEAHWKPSSSWDLIKVQRGYTQPDSGSKTCYQTQGSKGQTHGLSLPLKIIFTEEGKKFTDWSTGRTWGLRWHLDGKDRGVVFKIKLKIENVATLPIGPNPVLPEQRAPNTLANPIALSTKPPRGSTPKMTMSVPQHQAFAAQTAGTRDRLFNLVQGAYFALNATNPNRTSDCWLCLTSSPPYYEGLALNGRYFNTTTPTSRCLAPVHRLTLSEVSGKGLCLGSSQGYYSMFCNSTIVPTGSSYLEAPNGTVWACNTGLTSCVSTAAFNATHEFCVLVQLWPRVLYHEGGTVVEFFEQRHRFAREPVSLTIALLLGIGGIAAGIGTGTTAILQTSHLAQLQMAMTSDLEALEKSVSALEKSLTSLSEVVLQNRRGLDLLFLKEGGLCAALKEECCFYADHTGVVRESMEKLRKRLAQRRKEYEDQQGWFDGMFAKTPWLSTLIPTLAGPLIVFLLLLSFGPWAFQRLTRLIKNQVDSAFSKNTLSVHYHRVASTENTHETPALHYDPAQQSEPAERLRFSDL